MQPVTYDRDADALYVQLRDGASARQQNMGDLRIVDFAEDGGVLGFEFLGASEGVDLADLPFADTIARLIRESGLPIPIFAD